MASIANFTPDTIEWTHLGESGVLNPDDIVEVSDSRANHILNTRGQRGLVRLSFGDDEEVKRADSMRLYHQFWERQITTFNQLNDQRKNESKPYLYPTNELATHAASLGLELITPGKVNVPTHKSEVNELSAVVLQQAEQIEKLTRMVNAYMSSSDTSKEIRKSFLGLSKTNFRPFVLTNLEEIATWPEDVMSTLTSKWDNFYPDTPRPWEGDEE